MKKFKKIAALSLSAIMAVSLAACGGSQKENTASSQTSAAASSDGTIVLTIASADGSGGITHNGMLEFEKKVEERSEGRIDVQIHMDSLLGGEREITEGMLLGSIQMAPVSEGIYAVYDNNFSILELPYLFADYDAFNNACDGELGEYLNGLFEKYGFTCFGIFSMGYRGVITKDKKVLAPSDMSGMKLRVPEVDSYIDAFAAIGANPTPMSWSEIYTGLQQGTIDGMESSPPVINDSKFQEVTKYFTATNHIMSTGAIVLSTKFYESLPEDLKVIVKEECEAVNQSLRTAYIDNWSSTLDSFESDYGIEVTYLDDAQYEAFKELVMPLYESKWNDQYGKDLIDMCFSFSK